MAAPGAPQPETSSEPVDWRIDDALVAYPDAIAFMERRVAEVRAGTAPDSVWLLEHPPLYTAGTSAQEADLIEPDRFPVFKTGRGGQYTYHGPGQRVGYVMLDLKKRNGDLRRYVQDLEEWIIRALASFNVKGERREGRVGIWVDRGHGREDKIAAIGVRVRQWVTFHGIAINLDPDLTHFGGIVPCGIAEHGVTSLADLGLPVTMADLDVALRVAFEDVFGHQARENLVGENLVGDNQDHGSQNDAAAASISA
ncbi:lipoyl(octanoyl) transferase LipB [Pelagibius sp. Alg239-R121]|uniref:lipoyl(octanoyl) transferase LipB n=1 Tax=Pelagibius sp. Alg239-R121 TaxID=2993448 RepID=UPI002AC351C7|nr:lipoyl(octanoyl) transferase LipB [Pelagibius sp. Alg239-R121]